MYADIVRRFVTTSQFAVLWRAFVEQFFTSETVTSDMQLRQTMIGVLTFLLPPGLFMMVSVFPQYELIVRFHPSLVDQARMRLALIFVAYAMVTTGFIAVFVWEGLTFERRDAMVLGPLPLRGATVIGAKLAALATLMTSSALAINLMTALPFASVTANHLGGVTFFRDGAAHLIATIGAAVFVFSSLVVARALVMLLGSPRMAARLGSLLQFLFVASMLCFVLLLPALSQMRREAFLANADATLNPGAWFLGLFECVHGSPEPGFATLARRASIALAIALGGGVILSIVSVRLQMQRALAPVASASALGRASIGRMVARVLIGRDPVARATADFVLLTIARNRAQQGPIAITAAIALAVIVAGLAGRTGDLRWMTRPAADVLSIPLVLAFGISVGLRASFFVPSELPAAWAFRANAPDAARSYWSATRAVMLAFVLPPMLAITALLAAIVSWRIAAWHALFVAAMTVLLVQLLTLTFSHVPFTRPYEPGHTKLRTRWPLYFFGLSAFAYSSTRGEWLLLTSSAGSLTPLVTVAVLFIVVFALLETIGRRLATRWVVEEPEQSVDDSVRLTVLDLGPTPASARLLPNGPATNSQHLNL